MKVSKLINDSSQEVNEWIRPKTRTGQKQRTCIVTPEDLLDEVSNNTELPEQKYTEKRKERTDTPMQDTAI